MADNLSGWVIKEWNKLIKDPSYSPLAKKSEGQSMKEKDFHKMFSHMLMAMKREIAEFPTPYPLVNNSSNNPTITPAKANQIKIKIAFPAPNSDTSPYIPDQI